MPSHDFFSLCSASRWVSTPSAFATLGGGSLLVVSCTAAVLSFAASSSSSSGLGIGCAFSCWHGILFDSDHLRGID
ncbi:unnamed protein product [Linum trigynum]|uniref:Secreted protein n=1 Tax=Linum trigynum TaxID=586398 RepID=A0AAV2GL52_9ROSI